MGDDTYIAAAAAAEDVVARQPAAVLAPEQLANYRRALALLKDRQELLDAARAAVGREQFLTEAVGDRCAKLWAEICAAHALDDEVAYTVDASGRVYIVDEKE